MISKLESKIDKLNLKLEKEINKLNERLYMLKIQLLDIKPIIWRRFMVPASITIDRLHDVIQIVMGWSDIHLHCFEIGKLRYTENPEYKEDGKASEKYQLRELIKQNGRKIFYHYDFGDNWEHEIILENNNYFDPELIMPLVCLEGKRECPPEDVGGVPGYMEFCKILKDPKHKDHKNYLSWSGGHFDSEQFDVENVNLELMKYLRWSRNRFQNWALLN